MSALTDRITVVLQEEFMAGCTAIYDPRTARRIAQRIEAELQPELGELEAAKMLLAATRDELRRTIADFCAARDALPRATQEEDTSDDERWV